MVISIAVCCDATLRYANIVIQHSSYQCASMLNRSSQMQSLKVRTDIYLKIGCIGILRTKYVGLCNLFYHVIHVGISTSEDGYLIQTRIQRLSILKSI